MDRRGGKVFGENGGRNFRPSRKYRRRDKNGTPDHFRFLTKNARRPNTKSAPTTGSGTIDMPSISDVPEMISMRRYRAKARFTGWPCESRAHARSNAVPPAEPAYNARIPGKSWP